MARTRHRSDIVLVILVAALLATVLSPVRAQTLAVPGSVTGTLSASAPVNTYALTVPTNGDVTFTIADGSMLNTQVFFWDSDGTTEINSMYCNATESNTITIPHLTSAATYYVSVEVNTAYGSYAVSNVLVAKSKEANDREPDNSYTQALSFPIGKTVKGHLGYSTTSYSKTDFIDWYKVVVSASGAIRLTASTDINLNAFISLVDTDGKTQITGFYCNANTTNTILAVLPKAGTHYVAVQVNTGYGGYAVRSQL